MLIPSSPKIPDGTKCVNTLILYTATFEIFIFAKFEQNWVWENAVSESGRGTSRVLFIWVSSLRV